MPRMLLPMAIGAALALSTAAAHAQDVSVRLVSHAYNNPATPVSAYDPQISADGYWVGFSSTASGFVAPGADGFYGADAFVYNVACQSTEIVSVAWNGTPANGPSGGSLGLRVPLSGDGRYVAFTSSATNLVHGDVDNNGYADVFLVDRAQPIGSPSRVRRISAALGGGGGNATSSQPLISADGNYVVFQSDASNLVAGDTNGTTDVFIYSIFNNSLSRATHDMNGGPTNGYSDTVSINGDGSRLVFRSGASDLTSTPTNGYPQAYMSGPSGNTLISRNNQNQIASQGVLLEFAISGSGSTTAFVSTSSNLWSNMSSVPQLFLRRPQNGTDTLTLVTLNPGGGPGPVGSRRPSLNSDGQYLAFDWYKWNWTPGEPWNGIYRMDTNTGALLLMSPGLNGQPENGGSTAASLSANGGRVAFRSTSSNLVSGVSGSNIFLSSKGSWPRRCAAYDRG